MLIRILNLSARKKNNNFGAITVGHFSRKKIRKAGGEELGVKPFRSGCVDCKGRGRKEHSEWKKR